MRKNRRTAVLDWTPCPDTAPRRTWQEADTGRERMRNAVPDREYRIEFISGYFELQWRPF